MSASALIADGFGSFGDVGHIVSLGLDIGAAVIVDSQLSGGYYETIPRKRSVKEEREELGIIPKSVKKLIKQVVEESIEENQSEAQAEKLFKAELERREIANKQIYMQALEAERDRMISLEIYRHLRIKKMQDDEDDDNAAIHLLLM